jgi:2'-5' RNA ligase
MSAQLPWTVGSEYSDGPNQRRFGVFLIPDAPTCAKLTQTVGVLAARFGITSAAAFPPHITLIGSLATDQSTDRIMQCVADTVSDLQPFEVHNSGLVELGGMLVYDMDRNADGSRNVALAELRDALAASLTPVSRRVSDYLTTPWQDGEFHAHVSVASHELLERPELVVQVRSFLADLEAELPQSFTARTVALFEFLAPDFAQRWWPQMSWRQVSAWSVPRGGNAVSTTTKEL